MKLFLRTGPRAFADRSDLLGDAPASTGVAVMSAALGADRALVSMGDPCGGQDAPGFYRRASRDAQGYPHYAAFDPIPADAYVRLMSPKPERRRPITLWSPMGAAVADLDGDGRDDLGVSLNFYVGRFQAREATPFADRTTANGPPGLTAAAGRAMIPWGLAYLDLDQDGRPDELAAHGNDHSAMVDPAYAVGPQRVRALWNAGNFRWLDVTAALHLGLRHWHQFARRQPNLQRYKIDARHHFSNRMLNLNAAVDLDEVRLPVGADQELKGAEVAVPGGTDRLRGARQELFANLWRECRRWRLFDELLMSSLYGAVALTEVQRGARLVDGDLHLNVVRVDEVLLEVERPVAERRLRLLGAEREELRQVVGVLDHAHAATAAAGRGLQYDRVADLCRGLRRRRFVGNDAVRTRNRWQAVLGEQRAHSRLALEALQHVGRWANKGESVRGGRLGEGGVLRKEAIARVNGVAAGGERRRDYRGRREVAALSVGGPNADRLVGNEHGARFAVSLAIGDNRFDAELATGAQDAQRNLATVGDEYALNHSFPSPTDSSRKSSWPYSTGSPVAQRSLATMPP
jgi:hypothetical protein